MDQAGGYHEAIDDSGKFVTGEKFLTLQARQVWFFSNLAVNDIDQAESVRLAEHGLDGLRKLFYDKKNGGYFLKIGKDGSVIDNRKHAYPLSFVIYGLVELHRANGDESVLDEALKLFELLEKHCYDAAHGGYYELFDKEWKKITDTEQWGVVGTVGFKTYNTHLHLLEAFTQLYIETKNELVGKRLAELIEICTVTIKHPNHRCNIDAWTTDWKMVETEKNLRVSYGHDLECAWLVLAAADALGKRSDSLNNWAVTITEHAIEFGLDKVHGGFFYSGPLGEQSEDRKKEWWTQSEALLGLITINKITNDEKYLTLFKETLDFVERNHVSPDGGWFAQLNEDGSLGQNKSRTSMWQGGYHNGRALLMSEALLRSLD
jgi:mannobiose 2-epimerase